MISRPEVGLPADHVPPDECSYALDIDQPTCGQPTRHHLLSSSPAWGLVAMSACPRHLPIARAAAEVVAEHDWTDPLCATGDCWRATLDG